MQEGWQGEEPYMHPESDKSNVAAVKHKYIHVGAQYEYDINRSITQLPTALCNWTKGSIIRQYRKPKKSIAAISAMASLKWLFLRELYLVHFTIEYLFSPSI